MTCNSFSTTTILTLSSGVDNNDTVTTRTRLRNSPTFCTRAIHNKPSVLSHSFHFELNANLGNYQHPKTTKRYRLSPIAATTLELPLLPFNMNEVLVPSESKTLHLYEARYLALLEESLLRKKLFVHFVLDPILVSNSGTEAQFAARYGCLVNIENIVHLEVGALVSIRGICRVKLLNFLQSDPYLKGEVIPMQDQVINSANQISSKVIAVKEALRSLNSLEIKLKAPKEELLQTSIANSLAWSEKEPCLECDQAFIPSPAERISFAAFQPISGSTQSEMLNLQQKKLRAMDMKDTLERLDNSLELVSQNISVVAAKLAIQSLDMQ